MVKLKQKQVAQKSNADTNPEKGEPTGKEASLSPPVLDLGNNSEKEETKEDNFDIDFDLLPPELKLKIYELGLDADVKGVSISHEAKSLSTKFNFEYDGAASLNLDHGDLNHTMGFDFGSSNLSYGGSYRDVNWASNYNFGNDSFGLSLGYGAPLRPSRDDVNNTFQAGAQGLNNMAGTISSATDDPVAYAEKHKDDVKTISKAISMAKKLRKMDNKRSFGAGLRLGYSPQNGLSVFVGAQMRF